MISIFELKNWWFSKEQNNKESWYNVRGNCFNNPRSSMGVYVQVAKITRIEVEEKGLIVHSADGSYFCSYEFAMEESYEFMSCRELFEEYDINKFLIIQDEMERGKEKRRVSEIICTSVENEADCLVLFFSDEFVFYNKKAVLKRYGTEYELPIDAVEGDLSDYVAIGVEASSKEMPALNKELDFRYFPRCSGWLHFYVWNGYKGKVFAQNVGKRTIKVASPYGDFSLIPDGSFYEIAPESFRGRITKQVLI